jgi:hypothetical protein
VVVGQGSSLGLTAVPIWIQDFIAREGSRVRVWGWMAMPRRGAGELARWCGQWGGSVVVAAPRNLAGSWLGLRAGL